GEYTHAIDTKGRIIMPAKFREQLGEQFVVTRGMDACLFVFPMHEWTQFQSKLRELPLSSKDARAITRFFFAGATECEVDKQGRILLSQTLQTHAGLEKDCVIIGVMNRIEIWNGETWTNYNASNEANVEAVAERLLDLF
ncbi:MAG: division/cell wall cluster transcriptional repressor MraZ, partial [Bacilli bacterium]